MRKFSPSPHQPLPWARDHAHVRYAVIALAMLALLLAGARYASRAPGPAEVPAIELLSDPGAKERPEPTEPRKKQKHRKPKPSSGGGGGAAPAPAPAPAPAGDDDSDEGDDD